MNEVKQAWREWLSGHSEVLTHAVTLTMKQNISHGLAMPSHGGGVLFEPITLDGAKDNFRMFRNILNRSVYHSAWDRYGKGIYVVPVIEGWNGLKPIHIHCAMGFPERQLSDAEIENKVRLAWNQTVFGKRQTQIVVEPMYDKDGWLGYIQKSIDSTGDVYILDSLSLPKEDVRS